MNSIEELLDNGIELYTAEMMLREYSGRIGTMNGVYEIKDINYDFSERGKDVTLQCIECGKVIHRIMISGRNKWSELIKSCPCQKQKKKEREKAEFEKFQKIKKAALEEKLDACVGELFGDFSIDRRSGEQNLIAKCRTCGYEKTISINSFENKCSSTMHCKKHYVQPVKFDETYIGKKNNFLTVKKLVRIRDNRRAFLCKCDCGQVKVVEPCQWEQGIVKSCGCYYESLKVEHSEELDRLRRIHNGMMQRCYNPKSEAYMYYGGRGISICPEWKDRENFIEWALQNGYDNNLSIDRIDVNGNYEPSNCRWATAKQQANNQRPRTRGWKRAPKTILIDGVKRPISEWYSQYEVTGPTVAYRMKTYGISFEEALKMPRMTIGRPRKKVSDGR